MYLYTSRHSVRTMSNAVCASVCLTKHCSPTYRANQLTSSSPSFEHALNSPSLDCSVRFFVFDEDLQPSADATVASPDSKWCDSSRGKLGQGAKDLSYGGVTGKALCFITFHTGFVTEEQINDGYYFQRNEVCGACAGMCAHLSSYVLSCTSYVLCDGAIFWRREPFLCKGAMCLWRVSLGEERSV